MKNIDKDMSFDEKQYKTPMMQQYLRIKKQYKDCLLLFRMGDFYEMFLDDAKKGSKILGITLTDRSKGKDGKIPMAGIPYHALENYIGKIIRAGYKAAICEQLTEPSNDTKIVERGVVRIVTAGTLTNDKLLQNNKNNYLVTLGINKQKQNIIFAYTDISTGEFGFYEKKYTNDNLYNVINTEIHKLDPSEVILQTNLYENHKLLSEVNKSRNTSISKHDFEDKKLNKLKYLNNFFQVKTLSVFNINESNTTIIDTLAILLSYIKYTQKDNIHHLKRIDNKSNSKQLKIDIDTYKNLEIFSSNTVLSTNPQKSVSLIDVLDKTSTAMGSRLLRRYLATPLIDKKSINNRLDCIEYFISNSSLKEETLNILTVTNDIERMLSKIGINSANARDLVSLKNTLQNSVQLLSSLQNHKKILNKNNYTQETLTFLQDKLNYIIEKIEGTFVEEPPNTVKEGKMIKRNVNEELDRIKSSIKESKDWITNLELQEKKRTKIQTLKVRFNNIFGYYIEVSKANSHIVPDNYIRKQTLVNAERYITPELKEKEEIVLNAEEKINKIEHEIFVQTSKEILKYTNEIQQVAKITSQIDVYNSMSRLALENNYIKPTITNTKEYSYTVTEGRHPMVEYFLDSGEFAPNSTKLTKDKYFHLITGPNMAGKSTYIRQVAITQIMAHIGSYIPAFSAKVALVDGIYTRIGAGDALSQGLSTFMVEMIETSKILNNATENSLVILDEVGRGTSTIDGLSIARAIVEYLHNKIKCKTLFATHYHELTNLNQRLQHLENYQIKVIERGGSIQFLHKVVSGFAAKSYGIEVAKLAGLPEEVIVRANQLLNKKENDQLKLDL